MPTTLQGELILGDAKVAIVVGRFNQFITGHLLEGAIDAWQQLGGDPEAPPATSPRPVTLARSSASAA